MYSGFYNKTEFAETMELMAIQCQGSPREIVNEEMLGHTFGSRKGFYDHHHPHPHSET